MATIKDIARSAGVSHATVSNVFNHKGNVSAQKIKLVMETAKRMGYRTNEAASALRSGSTMTIAVILPNVDSIAYGDLYTSVCHAAEEKGYGILLKTTGNVPGLEARAIEDILSSRARYCISVSSFPEPQKQYLPLSHGGIKVLFALRGRQEEAPYAGFDMIRAGRDIGKRLILDGHTSIGLMTNMTLYPAEADFRVGLLTAFKGSGGNVRCVQSISSQYSKNAFSLLDGDIPDAIVTTEEEMAQAALRACAFLGRKTSVYTLAAKRTVKPSAYQSYMLDFRSLGEKMVASLLDESAFEPISCQGFEEASVPFVQTPCTLSMLSADTPATHALQKLLPRLENDTGIRLSITLLPTEDVSRAFLKPAVISAYDIVRMDLSLMNTMAAQVLMPLDQLCLDTQGIFSCFLPGMTQEYSIVGGRPLAFPFDPGCHLLFYRQDILRDSRTTRAFLETHHEQLSIPTTRQAYAQLAEFLDDISKSEHALWRGAILTRRASECVSDLAALGQDGRWPHLTADDIEAYCLRQRMLERSALFGKDGSWNSAVARFAQGEGAMLIAHSNYACGLVDDPLSYVSGRVGFAPAPGSKAFLGGGIIGVVRKSNFSQAVATFFSWLYQNEISNVMALLCGCSPWAQAYERRDILDIYPWLHTVRIGLTNGVRRSLFAAGRDNQMRTEKDIAAICQRALDGTISAHEAAQAVNERA